MDKPIRVLHEVTSMDTGGVETLLMNIYRNIDRTKIQFDFMLHREAGSGFYDKEILELGGKLYSGLPFNPLHHKKYLQSLDNFFDTHPEYKILHAHNAFSMYTLRSAKKHDVPVRIAHSHNTAPRWNDYKTIFKLYAKVPIKKYCTDMFACSKPAGKYYYGKKAIKEGKVKIIKNGIMAEKFIYSEKNRIQYRKELKIQDKFAIIHIGRFNIQKNHEFLIDIYHEIFKMDKDTVLVLIGEGVLKEKIKKKVEKLKIGSNVIFLDARSDIDRILSAMDVFVLPSFFEGLGIVAIESQATGLPCIVAETIPNEAYITDKIKSISLKKSAKEWATEILNIKYNPSKRESMTKNVIESGFDIKDTTRKLQQFYLSKFKN